MLSELIQLRAHRQIRYCADAGTYILTNAWGLRADSSAKSALKYAVPPSPHYGHNSFQPLMGAGKANIWLYRGYRCCAAQRQHARYTVDRYSLYRASGRVLVTLFLARKRCYPGQSHSLCYFFTACGGLDRVYAAAV